MAAAEHSRLYQKALEVVESVRVRRARVVLLTGAAGLTLLVIGAALLLPRLAAQRPEWWREVSIQPARRAEIASALDNGALTMMTEARPLKQQNGVLASEPWVATIRGDDASAWLSERLPQWLANQRAEGETVPGIDEIQSRFADGRIYAGLRLKDRSNPDGRWLWTTLTPAVDERGLFVRADSLWVGRLSLPAATVLAHSGDDPPPLLKDVPAGAALADALRGARPLAPDASIRLPDGRRVRLLKVEVRDDVLVLTCRTEMQ